MRTRRKVNRNRPEFPPYDEFERHVLRYVENYDKALAIFSHFMLSLHPNKAVTLRTRSIHAAKHLDKMGMEELHGKILPGSISSSSIEGVLNDEDSAATLFIDFDAIRIFGNRRKEFYRLNRPSSRSVPSGSSESIEV